jgi:hypothetical protein
MASAVSAALWAAMSAQTTRAPSIANLVAAAWPMPLPAPVTIAAAFSSRPGICAPHPGVAAALSHHQRGSKQWQWSGLNEWDGRWIAALS